MPPLNDRCYLRNTPQRKNLESFHARAQLLKIKNLTDLENHLNIKRDELEEHLSKWLYNEHQITFDVFITLSETELAEVYQRPSSVMSTDDNYLEEITKNLLTEHTDNIKKLNTIQPNQAQHQDHTIINMSQNTVDDKEEKLDGAPNQFNNQFLFSLIDFRSILNPMTWSRIIWLMILVGSLAGIAYAAIFDNFFSGLQQWAEINSIPSMVVLYAYEPLNFLLQMILTDPYPADPTLLSNDSPPLLQVSRRLSAPSPNPDLALIIPCHQSAEFIGKTIRAALRHVAPHQIFIMDNGRSETPSDNTKQVVHAIHSQINYFWLPKIGNKTIALAVGADFVKKHRRDLSIAIICDDDTLIPDNFTVRREFFKDESVQGIVYPIRGKSPYKKVPLLSRWQDLEYKITDLENFFFDQSGAVFRPHGAASLWKIKLLVNILKKHNTIFKGEDVEMGRIMQVLQNESGGAKLRLDKIHYFETTVPQTFFGDTPNLYQQRVRSWNEAMFLYPWNLMIKPLLMIHRGSPTAWLKIKNSETYNLYMHLMYILRIPFTILVGKKALYWAILAGIKGGDFLLGLLFNFVKLPPHLRSDRLTAFTFPLYKEALSLMGTLSFLRVLFISGSKEPHPRSLNYQLGHGTIEISDEARKPRPAEGSASLTSSKSLLKHTSSGYFFHHPQRKLTRSASLTNTIQHGEAMNASSASSFFSESTRLNTNKTINPPNLHRPKGDLVDDLPSESKDPSLANHSDSQDITAHAIPGENVSQIKQQSKFTKFAKPAAKGNFPTDQTVGTYQIREIRSKATTSYQKEQTRIFQNTQPKHYI